MQNVSIQRAGELSAGLKSAVEALLGRPLEPDEEVSVMAFRPHEAPSKLDRQEISHRLKQHMDKMAERVKDVPEEELDDILDEAMRSVRPGYTSRK